MLYADCGFPNQIVTNSTSLLPNDKFCQCGAPWNGGTSDEPTPTLRIRFSRHFHEKGAESVLLERGFVTRSIFRDFAHHQEERGKLGIQPAPMPRTAAFPYCTPFRQPGKAVEDLPDPEVSNMTEDLPIGILHMFQFYFP